MIDPYLFKALVERRENRAEPSLEEVMALIGELIRSYGSQCAAYHSGPQVTRAYQACMAEIQKHLGVA